MVRGVHTASGQGESGGAIVYDGGVTVPGVGALGQPVNQRLAGPLGDRHGGPGLGPAIR